MRGTSRGRAPAPSREISSTTHTRMEVGADHNGIRHQISTITTRARRGLDRRGPTDEGRSPSTYPHHVDPRSVDATLHQRKCEVHGAPKSITSDGARSSYQVLGGVCCKHRDPTARPHRVLPPNGQIVGVSNPNPGRYAPRLYTRFR